jgi:hypothetical protein
MKAGSSSSNDAKYADADGVNKPAALTMHGKDD